MRGRRHYRPWKEELKDLFDLHASERRGAAVLLTILLCAAGWAVYEQFLATDMVRDKAALELAYAQLKDPDGSSNGPGQRSDHQPVDQRAELFPFDPNGLPLEQWVALGLSERQAASIHRFEAKGGRFRTKGDVAKMRVVDADLFARWEPYIRLPDSIQREAFAERPRYPDHDSRDSATDRFVERSARTAKAMVEINTADTARLVEVRGIGPAFARGIVKYRERLGGFHSLDQLSEVYILRDKPEAVAELKSRLLLDTSIVRRFHVNAFTAEELGPHPYAGWKVAKALVAYRQQHGPFRSVAEIKGCVLVTDSVYRKLAPYLSAE